MFFFVVVGGRQCIVWPLMWPPMDHHMALPVHLAASQAEPVLTLTRVESTVEACCCGGPVGRAAGNALASLVGANRWMLCWSVLEGSNLHACMP